MDDKNKCSSGLMEIMKETIRILSKSKKLVASITAVSILISCFLFFLNTIAITPLLQDMVTAGFKISKTTKPDGAPNIVLEHTADYKRDYGLFIAVELVFFLVTLIISVLTISAIIYASAMSYLDKSLSIKDLVLSVARSWKRLFITCLYTTLMAFGFVMVFSILFIPLYLISGSRFLIAVTIGSVVGLFAVVFFIYISVGWVLAIVITAIEEDCYGTKAFGKASKLVKGNRSIGFFLMSMYNLLALIMSQVLDKAAKREHSSSPLAPGLIIVELLKLSSTKIVFVLLFVGWTALYFRCKRTHGEGTELQRGDFEYSKLQQTTAAEQFMINKDIP